MPDFSYIVTAIMAACGGITALGGAAAVVINAVKAMRRPNDRQNEVLADHEKRLAALEQETKGSKAEMAWIGKISTALVNGMLAMLYPVDEPRKEEMRQKAYEQLTSLLAEK